MWCKLERMNVIRENSVKASQSKHVAYQPFPGKMMRESGEKEKVTLM